MTDITLFTIYVPVCIIPICLINEKKDEFANNKAIVFDGIHYLHIYLLNKRYDKLADNLNIKYVFQSGRGYHYDERKDKKIYLSFECEI